MKLFILHGWAYSIEPWQVTVNDLEEQGIDVVQLKVPGLTAPSDEVWTVEKYVEWLRQELKSETQPVLLGHSNGGRIAMHYDVAYPGHLGHLILLNSAGIETEPSKLSWKRKVIKALSKVLSPLKHLPGLKKVVYRLLKSDYHDAPANMKKTLSNLLTSDASFDASRVSAPTSIIWGEADRVTPLKLGKKLHRLISSSSLTALPDWPHAPYRTHPHQLAEEIVKTLEASR